MSLKDLLNKYYETFDVKTFIVNDPISIPHRFTNKEDVEISGFLASTVAWGNRKAIIKSCNDMMERMDNKPYDFVVNACEREIQRLSGFYYRTFNESDLVSFIFALKNIYQNHGGLEAVFTHGYNVSEQDKVKHAIIWFRKIFFEAECPLRVQKHVANPEKGSAAKRINMFLRWMVRDDENGVDFGLWKNIDKKDLIIPMDVHVGNTARKLHIIDGKANNWKAASELTDFLKTLDAEDPVKYDFALFGIGNAKINIDEC